MLVTDGILRASLRNSFAQPELLHPGKTCELTVDLWSTSLVFNIGHRIRVAISSSNAPRFEPNPNTGGKDRPRVATNTLHVSDEHPSHILLPIYRDTSAAKNLRNLFGRSNSRATSLDSAGPARTTDF